VIQYQLIVKAAPLGSNNPTVVNTVAKYYNIGRSGTAPFMFLNCIGFKKHPQNDCRTFEPNGELNYANRYVARSLSFDLVEIKDSFNNTNTRWKDKCNSFNYIS
jgi:hypothetical protein